MKRYLVVLIVLIVVSVCLMASAHAQPDGRLMLRMEDGETQDPSFHAIWFSQDFDLWGLWLNQEKKTLIRVGRTRPVGSLFHREYLQWWPETGALGYNPCIGTARCDSCASHYAEIGLNIPLNDQAKWVLFCPEAKYLWHVEGNLYAGPASHWRLVEGAKPFFNGGVGVEYRGKDATTYGRFLFVGGAPELRVQTTFPIRW